MLAASPRNPKFFHAAKKGVSKKIGRGESPPGLGGRGRKALFCFFSRGRAHQLKSFLSFGFWSGQ